MNSEQARKARAAAVEFIKRVDAALKEKSDEDEDSSWFGSAATGALRRQSMELTRRLAALRRSRPN